MGRKALRFIHAAELHLDEPLTGLGPISADERCIAEDATLIAWQRIVDACVDEDADFLLLIGGGLAAAGEDLRARLALQRGLETLAEHGIPVCIVADEAHSSPALPQETSLPANVTLIAGHAKNSVLISGDDQLAEIVVMTDLSRDPVWEELPREPSDRRASLFRIGVVPAPLTRAEAAADTGSEPTREMAEIVRAASQWGVNYLAVGGGNRRSIPLQQGVAHFAGPAQGLNPKTTGCCGCSLVEVPEGGPIRIESIPTAPIRFDEIELSFDGEVDWDTLIERMADAAAALDVGSSVKLWLIDWRLRGTAGILNELTAPAIQQELWELLDAELDDDEPVPKRHRLTLPVASVGSPPDDALSDELQQIVAHEQQALVEHLQSEAQLLLRSTGRQAAQLAGMVRSVSGGTLVANATAAALAHLQSPGRPSQPPRVITREWDVA